MKLIGTAVRVTAMLLMIAFVTSGCGLLNNAQREREQQNEAVTSGAQLGEVVTAEGIGANNAPVEVTNTFSSSQDYIYVVAQAERIEAGTSMFARWSRDGKPLEDSSELKADRLYEDTYVEFHLENLQQNFEPGNYSVQIFVNGNPAKEAQFTIR
jgi:hypothetical protein